MDHHWKFYAVVKPFNMGTDEMDTEAAVL